MWSGAAGVRALERLAIGGFDELDERAGQAALLEHPEAALGLLVVRAPCAQPLHELLPVAGGDDAIRCIVSHRGTSDPRLGKALQRLLDEREELVGDRAVDDAVIERDREVGAGADGDRVLAVGAR